MSMKQCPKCGGSSGYYENKIMHYRQQMTWSNVPTDFIETNVRGGKLKYCSNCNFNVTKYIEESKNGIFQTKKVCCIKEKS